MRRVMLLCRLVKILLSSESRIGPLVVVGCSQNGREGKRGREAVLELFLLDFAREVFEQ